MTPEEIAVLGESAAGMAIPAWRAVSLGPAEAAAVNPCPDVPQGASDAFPDHG